MSDDRDRIDELYREHRDEPPAELDAAILAAARDNAARPWYRDLRYLTTVATAASFVLAAMVVYYAPQEDGFSTAVPTTAPARERREDAGRTADRAPRPASPAAESAPLKSERAIGTSLEEAASQAPQATADAGRSLTVQDTAKHLQRTLSSAGLEANRTGDTDVSPADALATLADRCGPAPGTDDTRTLKTDVLGWYLTVTEADAVTFYRCENGSWREIDAPVTANAVSEQQPDPENDQ